MLEYAIEVGRGGMYLRQMPGQYAQLRRSCADPLKRTEALRLSQPPMKMWHRHERPQSIRFSPGIDSIRVKSRHKRG
jgi:hypothetical protein